MFGLLTTKRRLEMLEARFKETEEFLLETSMMVAKLLAKDLERSLVVAKKEVVKNITKKVKKSK